MMRVLKPILAFMTVIGFIGTAADQIVAGPVTVEFSEVSLPQLTLLDGTSHYDPYGLFFEDGTSYVIDSKIVGAGTDDVGITNTGNNLMTIGFTGGVTSVTFDWVTVLGSDIFADAYGPGGTLLQSQSATGLSGDSYGTFTFSGLGLISRVTFEGDGTNEIGIGRLTTFEAVPEPSSLTLLGIGVTGLSGYRWRRKRQAAA